MLADRAAGVDLDETERRIAEALGERPHSRARLSDLCGCISPRLLRVGRLESLGLARRGGPTPTDALHVLGRYEEFDVAAVRLAMRALGRCMGVDAEEAARLVVDEVERLLALAIVRRELTAGAKALTEDEFQTHRGLLERVAGDEGGGDFRLLWRQQRPVVA